MTQVGVTLRRRVNTRLSLLLGALERTVFRGWVRFCRTIEQRDGGSDTQCKIWSRSGRFVDVTSDEMSNISRTISLSCRRFCLRFSLCSDHEHNAKGKRGREEKSPGATIENERGLSKGTRRRSHLNALDLTSFSATLRSNAAPSRRDVDDFIVVPDVRRRRVFVTLG